MAIIYDETNGIVRDFDWTVARQEGPEIVSLPFSANGDQTTKVLKSRWNQNIDNWSPLSTLSKHPSVSGAVLVEEGDMQDMQGGGMVSWSRTYATIPKSRTEPDAITYPYPGIKALASGGYTITERLATTKAVMCSVVYEYFTVDTNRQYNSPGTNCYRSVAELPIIPKTEFYVPMLNGATVIGKSYVTMLGTGTVPSTATYLTWLQNPTANLLVIEESKYRRWMGQIFERCTRYVQPQ